jgi:hypothetical protein
MEGGFLMPGQYTEYAFETAIEDYLTATGGYEEADPTVPSPYYAAAP